MLPLTIDEEKVFVFEFWFDGTLRQGMYHQSELFSSLGTFDIRQRSQVYQFGCKLAQKNAIVVLTCSQDKCSLWGSLRSSFVKEILLNPNTVKLSNSDFFSSPPIPPTGVQLSKD